CAYGVPRDHLSFTDDHLPRGLHDQFVPRDPDYDFHGPIRIGDTDHPVRRQWNLRGRSHPLRPRPQGNLPVARGAEYPRDPTIHVARAADERPEAHPIPHRRSVTYGLAARGNPLRVLGGGL